MGKWLQYLQVNSTYQSLIREPITVYRHLGLIRPKYPQDIDINIGSTSPQSISCLCSRAVKSLQNCDTTSCISTFAHTERKNAIPSVISDDAQAAVLAQRSHALDEDVRGVSFQANRALDFVRHAGREAEASRLDRSVNALTAHKLYDFGRHVLDLRAVDGGDAEGLPRQLKALGHRINANDRLGALDLAPARGAQADRAQTPDLQPSLR